ncbi:MAG TPA: hypothetical protein VHC69_33560 [Polyangiaceae bacterium]|nr:hypothetical protein [Polyangiaceae bacterium]
MTSPQFIESNESALASNSSESSAWLLAQQRLRESGIPPAHERAWVRATLASETDDHVESALAECTRTEANIGALLRGLSHLMAGATAAREANTALLHELDAMRELLGRSNENELTLRCRVQSLERALETTERDAALSRAVLIEQEDLFLAELLTDHERELAALKHALAEAQGTAAGVAAAHVALTAEAAPITALPAPEEAPIRRDSKPALKQKPDPSTRPLVGYSLGEGDVAEEIIDTSRLDLRRP